MGRSCRQTTKKPQIIRVRVRVRALRPAAVPLRSRRRHPLPRIPLPRVRVPVQGPRQVLRLEWLQGRLRGRVASQKALLHRLFPIPAMLALRCERSHW